MDVKIAVLGLGYVGLPLARLFSTKYPTIGFDLKRERVDTLMKGIDLTNEVSSELLLKAINNGFVCSNNVDDISDCNVFIVTVPTPLTIHQSPDLRPLISASEIIGKVIKKGDVVIYESTVYPGATEEDCVPVIEAISGFKYNSDFYVGYSPERINPGDKAHSIETIKKVTSGSTPETADFVDNLYNSVIIAGTYKASSIKVAEASKIIENAQRDVNIAFINEVAMIFNRLGIDTDEVLDAASSKWNFVKLKPGLVGGHCIGVDPFYLIARSKREGFNPPIISAARVINDNMSVHISYSIIKLMNLRGILVKNSDILILGCTFKENCPDTRNSKVTDVITEFLKMNSNVDVFDPIAEKFEQNIRCNYMDKLDMSKKYDVIVLAVSHHEFLTLDLKSMLKDNGLIYDIKSVLPKEIVAGRL